MTGDSITPDELRAAIDRLGYYVDRHATHPAERIIRDVECHREPEYEPGGLYQDAIGQPFYRCPDGRWIWLPEGKPFSDHTPNRPLRKLVAEGSQAARLSRDAVIRDLRAAQRFEEDVEQTADRICKLLAAGDEGTCPGGC
jgi:hypothetical protein